MPGSGAQEGTASAQHRCLVVTLSGDTPFARNFNPFANRPLDFTWGGIYEPLIVVTNAGGGRRYDWLASGVAWSRDGRTLTLTIRSGVRWTDGVPLTNRDVLYTLTAGRQDEAMDQIGLTQRGSLVESIRLVGSRRVAIRLKRRDSTFVDTVLANNLRVIPEHVFAEVEDVSAWSNPNPVGTGPFAVVERFDSQGYTLGRNPDYWMKGAPRIPCIRRVPSASTEAAILQMVNGDVDLTNNYVPNVERTYVSRDPRHYHFFYSAATPPVGLYFDDTRYPYSLTAFRRAISRAIDRKTISRVAEFGYAPPVDAIGIDRIWKDWVGSSLRVAARRLASYNPAEARRMLVAAGFTYREDVLYDPRGSPVSIKTRVIAGWTDWVTAWEIMSRNLGDIGIRVDVEAVPTWGAWQPDAFSTKVPTLLWSNAPTGPTPLPYFAQNLDRAAFVPSGESAERTGNWAHFQSAEGTRLLKAFRNTLNRDKQERIAGELGRLWLSVLPHVPLFAGPQWSTFSTRHFVGFPSRSDFYIQPSFRTSDYVVALTRIRPA